MTYSTVNTATHTLPRTFKQQLMLLILALVAVIAVSAPQTAYAEQALISPGDQLNIAFVGEAGFEDPFEVDREGYITLPEVGQLMVSSLSIEDVTLLVKQQLSESYRQTERIQISLHAKRLLITVLGYVRQPGEVDIPGNGNLQMALTAAGGLKPGAQLNKVQLKRNGETLTINYKEYLDSGDSQLIPDLKPLDVIFIPSSPLTGNVEVEFDAASLLSGGDAAEKKLSVRIFGEVHNPGTFTFDEDQNLVDLLMRAGGVTRYASVEQIRLITDGDPKLFDLKGYLDSGNATDMPDVTAGATIFVPMKEEEVKTGNRTVYVMGEVFRPGAYESKAEATFFDILANAGGPTRYARTREIRVISRDGKVSEFDLQAYTEGLASAPVPQVRPGDAIFVPEKNDMNQTSWLKILMDLQMPEMNGYEATEAIRRMPELNDTPIVAMTANVMTSDKERCFSVGMNDFLPKPVQMNALENLLYRWLGSESVETLVSEASEETLKESAADEVETLLANKALDNKEQANEDQPEILSLSAIQQMERDIGKERCLQMIEIVNNELQKRSKALYEAFSQGDSGAIQHQAHTLKSTSASFGLLQLSGLSKQIEHYYRADGEDNADVDIDALVKRLPEVLDIGVTALENYRDTLEVD